MSPPKSPTPDLERLRSSQIRGARQALAVAHLSAYVLRMPALFTSPWPRSTPCAAISVCSDRSAKQRCSPLIELARLPSPMEIPIVFSLIRANIYVIATFAGWSSTQVPYVSRLEMDREMMTKDRLLSRLSLVTIGIDHFGPIMKVKALHPSAICRVANQATAQSWPGHRPCLRRTISRGNAQIYTTDGIRLDREGDILLHRSPTTSSSKS